MTQKLDLEKINDSDHLLNILIQCENVLDGLDTYSYLHWIDGEIVEGPIVSRYWVKISLLYPYNKMPDPRAGLRLLKHGVQVEFDRMERAPENHPAGTKAKEQPPEWLVRLSFPRRLLDQNEEADLEAYDDEINPDDVTDAQDTGMDDESSLHTDEQDPTMADPNAPPDQQDQLDACPPPR